MKFTAFVPAQPFHVTRAERDMESSLFYTLFGATEKKLLDLLKENLLLKSDLSTSKRELTILSESAECSAKELSSVKKLILAYEKSFESWKELEAENLRLKELLKSSEAKWKSNLETLTQSICSEKDVIIRNAESNIVNLKEELEKIKKDRAREADSAKEIIEKTAKSQAQSKLEFERKIVRLENELSARKTSVRNFSNDSSRLQQVFQKKYDFMKLEYENKISHLEKQLETAKRNHSQIEKQYVVVGKDNSFPAEKKKKVDNDLGKLKNLPSALKEKPASSKKTVSFVPENEHDVYTFDE